MRALGWRLMSTYFDKSELGIKQAILDKFWKSAPK